MIGERSFFYGNCQNSKVLKDCLLSPYISTFDSTIKKKR